MFLHEAKQIKAKKSFFYYVLVVPTNLKKVFSHCNFSDNSVQVLSSMHSNVQLLYLLLFFAVVVVVAVLIAIPNGEIQRM